MPVTGLLPPDESDLDNELVRDNDCGAGGHLGDSAGLVAGLVAGVEPLLPTGPERLAASRGDHLGETAGLGAGVELALLLAASVASLNALATSSARRSCTFSAANVSFTALSLLTSSSKLRISACALDSAFFARSSSFLRTSSAPPPPAAAISAGVVNDAILLSPFTPAADL